MTVYALVITMFSALPVGLPGAAEAVKLHRIIEIQTVTSRNGNGVCCASAILAIESFLVDYDGE